MKKKIYIISLISIILASYFIVNAENKSSFSAKLNYELYEERVKNICNKYLYKNNNEKWEKINLLINFKNDDNYLEIPEGIIYDFDDVKEKHRINMNNIYKCALLNIQNKSLTLIKNDLINKNPTLSKELKWKIIKKISKVKSKMNSIKTFGWWYLKCITWKEKSSIQKLAVLHQTTYQTCKYVNYLEYIKENNENVKSVIEDPTIATWISEIKKLILNKKDDLDNEVEHTYKVFPLAFQAYSEYENNITAHFLLELIRDDYIVLREKLHETLNPINQIAYKISNAMKY